MQMTVALDERAGGSRYQLRTVDSLLLLVIIIVVVRAFWCQHELAFVPSFTLRNDRCFYLV